MIDKILKLKKRDILFILGDFLFDSDEYKTYIEKLSKKKCRIKLLLGNHDSLRLYNESIFELQLPMLNYKKIWLSHCPIHPQEMRNKKGNIHGHLHKEILNDKKYFNVNIDVNNYEFVDFEKIKKEFE
jgi:calcineurin-like phosphoesterase family protein